MTSPTVDALSSGEPGAPRAEPVRLVGRYRSESVLGRGGMGVVYLGRDERLGREVALKAIPDALAGDTAWTGQFLDEAKSLASLHHPNIARIHGLQRGNDGAPYLILERVHGETLAKRLAAGPLPVADTLDIALQIADALEAAHGRGIVHRDLKPANVMLSHRGRVKILDFGIARRVTPAARAGPARDEAPGVLRSAPEASGTPGYMSPEQVLGVGEDARTDVFSLGAILFECFAGFPAFTGDTAEAIQAATLAFEPQLPARPDLPGPLADLVRRCLAKDPGLRPAGMAAVRDALVDAGPRASEREAVPAHLPGPSIHMPGERDCFVGRVRERAELATLLAGARLVTLTGPGGSGKTRLAVRLALDHAHRFPDGVWFVDLSALLDPERVPEAVAAAIGVRLERGGAPLEGLVRHLAGRRGLLLLDNCEHLIAACTPLARGLLDGCPSLHLLATSREWLGVPGEETYLLGPLQTPGADVQTRAEAMADIESVRLFVERARPRRPDLQLDEQTAPVIARLCRVLEGIPLAIELAAAQLDLFPLDVLEQRILEPSPGGPGEARPGTLEATIRGSYNRLHDEEQDVLRSLAVFAGGCTPEAASAVLDRSEFETLDRLTSLVDRSLLVVSPERSETRYRMLESVRRFAADALQRTGTAPDRAMRHRRFFADLGERAEPQLTGAGQAVWLARLERDHDNLLAAIDGCLAQQELGAATRLAAALYRFWFTRGHYRTGRRAIDRVLARDSGGPPSAARAKMLWGAGNLAVFQGEPAAAHPLFERSLAEYRALGDVAGTARALNGLGLAAQHGGDPDRARAHFEQSLALFRSIGELRGTGAVIGNLSVLLWYQHEYAAARPLMEETVEMARAGGATDILVQALADLGLLMVRGGYRREAVAPLRECFGLVCDLEARRAAVGALEATAELALAAGDVARAARGFGASGALRTAIGVPPEPYEQRDRAAVLAAVTAALGPDAYARMHAEGTRLSFTNAVGEALDTLAGLPEGRAPGPRAGS